MLRMRMPSDKAFKKNAETMSLRSHRIKLPLESMFKGLGKATLRGIKRCPKCGVVNGTRSYACKNRSCDAIFRNTGSCKKSSIVCKIRTSPTEPDVFSVRVHSRGPDYRNFVRVMTVADDTSSLISQQIISSKKATCFVCSKDDPCLHVLATRQCFSESSVLPIRKDVFSDSRYCSFLTEYYNGDPPKNAVQRVSKSTFVVRCTPTLKHPLGYLHIMFYEDRKAHRNNSRKHQCSCYSPKNIDCKEGYTVLKKNACPHLFMCLIAFASNSALKKEFASYFKDPLLISDDLDVRKENSATCLLAVPKDKEIESESNAAQVHVDPSNKNPSLLEGISSTDETDLNNVQPLDCMLTSEMIGRSSEANMPFENTSSLQVLSEENQGVFKSPSESLTTAETIIKGKEAAPALVQDALEKPAVKMDQGKLSHKGSENEARMSTGNVLKTLPFAQRNGNSEALSFETWLAGVNEMINSMEIGGRMSSPFVYYIPHEFFDLIRERINNESRKKRLPSSTIVVNRSSFPPVGTFTQYSWRIVNPSHIKKIFYSSIIPLQDCIFSEQRLSRVTDQNHTVNSDLIKKKFQENPYGGNHQCKSVCFQLEWIPDILPLSNLGELRVSVLF